MTIALALLGWCVRQIILVVVAFAVVRFFSADRAYCSNLSNGTLPTDIRFGRRVNVVFKAASEHLLPHTGIADFITRYGNVMLIGALKFVSSRAAYR